VKNMEELEFWMLVLKLLEMGLDYISTFMAFGIMYLFIRLIDKKILVYRVENTD